MIDPKEAEKMAKSGQNPLICSRCTTMTRARLAATVLSGNALCGICFMKARPETFSKEQVREAEAIARQIERDQQAQVRDKGIQRKRANKPRPLGPDRYLD